ncbi:NADase-type glycan-binding domain-containing protein [Streptomyces sp. NPDC059009]|uniref:NADase-type glycan-binding domain-containing protein n=1 Tax=Streptomyces sp. NPDC059009 TaxID=3346694 RepID=UPI0036956A98
MTTQNCTECDARVEPGQSFCDACGAVLSWNTAGARSGAASAAGPGAQANSGSASGPGSEPGPGWDAFARPARTTPPAPAAPDAAAPAPPATGPVPSPAAEPRATDSGLPRRPHPDAPPEPPATAGPAQPPANDPDMTDTAPNDPVPPYTPGPETVRSLLVPVSEPTAAPPPPAVSPVLPGRPDTERPQVRVPGPQQGSGNGLPCPWCSTPNRPDRHFCARCAMPLAETEDQTPAPLPWWRRLMGPGRNQTPWAGERPRLRRVFDNIGTWITWAVVLTLLIFAAVNLSDGIQATRDHFAKRAPVEPDGIRASRSYEGHPAKLAIDKLNNTWWGPGVAQSGQGEWLELSFVRPTRLLDVIITPGTSTRADQIGKSALPHRVKATVTKKDGSVTTRELSLDPGAGPQRRDFRVGEVTKVRFTIESAHAANDKKQVAIAEVELFGRSDGSRT